MYRRRRASGPGFKTFIILGVIAGITFFVYDNYLSRPPASPRTGGPVDLSSAAQPQVVAAGGPAESQSSGPAVQPGDVYIGDASLFIPSAGILAPITQVYLDGTSWDVTRLGTNVGHLQGTAWLDDGPGNIVLSGHVELSDGRQGVFAGLRNLQIGQPIILTRDGEERRYMIVDIKEVEPDDLTPLYPTNFERLTLITCGNYDFFSDEYEIRIVVIADRLS